MLTNLLIDSFLFWSFLLFTIGFAVYLTRVAIKMHEYEKQVNRGWDDLVIRAEKMVQKIEQLIHEVEMLKIETEETKEKLNQIKEKIS